MRHLIWLVPLFALSTAAAYYHQWAGTPPAVSGSPVMNFRDPYADRDGAREAEADLAGGKLILFTYGYQLGDEESYARLMKRQHNVTVIPIAGCVVTESLVRYARDYNAVVERHLRSLPQQAATGIHPRP